MGKPYESLLVISEMYFGGRDRILLIVPTPHLQQRTADETKIAVVDIRRARRNRVLGYMFRDELSCATFAEDYFAD